MLLYILTWRFSIERDRIAFHGSKLRKAPSTLRRRNLKTEVSLWKHIKSFLSRLRRRNLKTQQSPAILDLCLRKARSGKSRDYCDANFFVFKMFSVHTKTKSRVFKFIRFVERFRKAPFAWQISVDGRPNRKNNADFSSFSGVVWTGPSSLERTEVTDFLGKQQHEFSSRTWSARAPWNCGKFACQPSCRPATSRPFLKPRLIYLPRAKREGNLRATKSRGRARAT